MTSDWKFKRDSEIRKLEAIVHCSAELNKREHFRPGGSYLKFIDILRRHENLASGRKSKRSKKYGKWMVNLASYRKKYSISPKKWKAAGK